MENIFLDYLQDSRGTKLKWYFKDKKGQEIIISKLEEGAECNIYENQNQLYSVEQDDVGKDMKG